jgi:hypothetical protein
MGARLAFAGVVYLLFGFETRGHSVQAIDAQLATAGAKVERG